MFFDREFCKVNTHPNKTITMNKNGLAYCSIFFDWYFNIENPDDFTFWIWLPMFQGEIVSGDAYPSNIWEGVILVLTIRFLIISLAKIGLTLIFSSVHFIAVINKNSSLFNDTFLEN